MTDEGQIDSELNEIDQRKKEWEEKEAHYKKIIGDQGNQIGALNKAVDLGIEKQFNQSQPEDEWDFDPVQKDVTALRTEVTQMKQAEALRTLEERHPGFRDLPKNEAFMEWIQENPYRAGLYARADAMDINAANEMLSLWDERTKLADDLQVHGESNRKRALKDASMEKGSAGGARQNYMSREELRRIRVYEPDKWAANYDEYMKMYAERRVR